MLQGNMKRFNERTTVRQGYRRIRTKSRTNDLLNHKQTIKRTNKRLNPLKYDRIHEHTTRERTNDRN